MPRQNIFTGTVANDRTGDTLRVAAQKINETFIELYQYLGGDSDQLSSVIEVDSSGVTLIGSLSYSAETMDSDGTASLTKVLTVFNSTTPISVTLSDGNTVGQVKKFINDNSGAATVTPSNFAQGTSFSLAQNGSCETIWSGNNWHLTGGADSDTALTIAS